MGDNIEWKKIEKVLKQDLNIIFKDTNIFELTNYEKRKMIFEHLTENVSYDYENLENIRKLKLGLISKIDRDIRNELINTIFYKKGICNSISQYYKLLLECVGITSYCVVCDDGTEVNHQLNIVLDENTNCYSLDDVTSVIVNRGTKEEFFDYDLEQAHDHSQGLRKTEIGDFWIIIPNELIYFYVNKDAKNINELDKFPKDRIIKCNKQKSK